jgi:pSer/pThr/pTyr-binding forkhead associated (FHA) protein/tRNA A-37 threonylcarbamoyl transferase component Bud32
MGARERSFDWDRSGIDGATADEVSPEPQACPEGGSPMYAYLRVVAGPDQGRIFNLVDGTTLSIGRGDQSDTRLKDANVARLHCELQCRGNEFQLTDLETVNGTLVGGQKIQEHALKHGEEFQVGNTRMKLYSSASTVADTQTLVDAQKSNYAQKVMTDDGVVLTGKTFAHFELGPVLARGSTGAVYKARNIRDGKEVAVKVLHSEFNRDEENLKRFMRVMKAVVGTHHPNLIALCGAGKLGESCWFAMEYVDGEPLHKLIERLGTAKKISWRYTLSMGAQIARALGALHEKQVVHRNVTPQSILIRKQDKVAKLGDLIWAKVKDEAGAATASGSGELVGNVAYMAPERTRSDASADIRADIYSLGATLYTMLTGRPPFQGKNLVETIAHIRQDNPIPPKKFQDSIPDELQDAVETMLAKRPEMRFQTPVEAARALERVAKAQDISADGNKSAFIRLSSNPDAASQPPRSG